MFKERLKTTLFYIFSYAFVFAIYIGFIILLDRYKTLATIAGWVVGVIVSIVAIIAVVLFIHWLFIEPFKKAKE